MNDQNLIPNSSRSPSEVRENGRKGGLASGKARRERKALRDIALQALTLPIKKETKGSKLVSVEDVKSLADVSKTNITTAEALVLAQVRKAMQGDTRAFESLRDLIGEKPVNKNIQEVDIVTNEDETTMADDFKESLVKLKIEGFDDES